MSRLRRTSPRARTAVGLLVALAAALLVACAGEGASVSTPTATPTVEPTLVEAATPTAAQRDALEAVEARVAEVRGLAPLADVEERIIDRESAAVYLRADLVEEEGARIAEAQVVYELLGFIPQGEDLLELYAGLVASQVAGFYDPGEETLLLVDGEEELGALATMTLAHEFVHALQDQHFGLEGLIDAAQDDWDARLALLALVEGDATLAQTGYALRFLSVQDLLDVGGGEAWAALAKMERFPKALQRELLFPYIEGIAFAQRLVLDGGWVPLDRALAAPPSTTEQILHLQKFLAGEGPQAVALPDLAAALGERWRLQAANTLGEFLLRSHLESALGPTEAEGAAAGWAGDRWALYGDGADHLLFLVIEWDAPEELDAFFVAYLDLLDARGGWQAIDEDSALWREDDAGVYVSRSDGRATLLISTDGASLEHARTALGLP